MFKLLVILYIAINCYLQEKVLKIYFPFYSILETSFFIETKMVIYFSVYSPKQVNCPSGSSASSFMTRQ